jgi:serine protease
MKALKPSHRSGALLGLVALTALATGLSCANASASVSVEHGTTASTHSHPHGMVPTVQAAHQAGQAVKTPLVGNTLSYGGGVDGIGVTTGKEKVYIVFWGTQWGTQSTDSNGNLKFSKDTLGAAGRVQQMIKGLGTGGEAWSGVMTQYCQGVSAGATSCPASAAHVQYPTGGGTLAGVWNDPVTAPSAASEFQIGTEAVKAASHFGNTTSASNRNAQYVIFSAKGTNPDHYKTNGFCAWHDWNGDLGVGSGVGDVALTNLPYLSDVGASCGAGFVNSGSSLDGYTIVEGHEYAETITDQNPAGGWTASSGQENADECAWISSGQGKSANVSMGNGSYPMQSTWSNDTNRCDLSHVTVT